MSIITSGVGRIGKDAVTRTTKNGDSVTSFSLAMDDGFGDKKVTHWFECSGWGKRYEAVAQYLLKGTQVFVVAEQGEREYEGKIYKTLRLQTLDLVGGKPSEGTSSRAPQREPVRSRDFVDDELPPF